MRERRRRRRTRGWRERRGRTTRTRKYGMDDVVPEHLYMSASPRPALAFPFFFLLSHPPTLSLASWKAMTRSSQAPVFQAPQQTGNCRCYGTSSNVFSHLGIISTIGVECAPAFIGRLLPHLSTIAGTPEEAACPGACEQGIPSPIDPPDKSSPIQPQTPQYPHYCPRSRPPLVRRPPRLQWGTWLINEVPVAKPGQVTYKDR